MIHGQQKTSARTAHDRFRVLFDCPGAWAVLNDAADTGIGGAELRAVTFARQLAQHPEFDVQIVVRPPERANAFPPTVSMDQLTIHLEPRSCATLRPAWTSSVQRFTNRLQASLTKRLARIPERRPFVESINFDLICCFGVTNRTASLIRTARRLGRRQCVFMTTDRTLSDIKLVGRGQRGIYGEQGWMVRYALTHADEVIVQKASQQRELQRLLGIGSRIIRNPIDLSFVAPEPLPELPSVPFALWVGRADFCSKRTDVCWQLAELCPQVPIVAIVNRHDASAYQRLVQARPRNVTLIPFVAPSSIEHYFRHATLLINTSDAEGFPNAFLQAGKYGIPVLSLNVDPDAMLHHHGAGICCEGSITGMAKALPLLMRQGDQYRRCSQRAQSYTRRYHDMEQCCQQLSALIRDMLASQHQADICGQPSELRRS